jgi:hypothetical protein
VEGSSSQWVVDEFGVKRRSLEAKFALPTPFVQASSYVRANFVDTLQIDEPSKHAMIETEIKFEGIPGGCCSMQLRQCLSETSGGKADFSVSAEIKAPDNSWFKGIHCYYVANPLTLTIESIRNALISQMRTLYHQISAGLGIDDDENIDATFQQVYFDAKAFKTSLMSLLPVLILFV